MLTTIKNYSVCLYFLTRNLFLYTRLVSCNTIAKVQTVKNKCVMMLHYIVWTSGFNDCYCE